MAYRADCIVLGGGISGLAAAFYAKTLRNFNRIVLLESSSRFGGWIESTYTPDHAIHELGPRSIRPAGLPGANTLDLVSSLGLGNQLLPVSKESIVAKNRYIYARNKLHKLPSDYAAIRNKHELFSSPLFHSILKEPFRSRGKAADESIGDFFDRRFNKEISTYLVDALCRGIFAGKISELSIKSCFPSVYDAEQRSGSLVVGFMFAPTETDPAIGNSDAALASRSFGWSSWSLKRGLQMLPDRLATYLTDSDVDMRTLSPCSRIEFIEDTQCSGKKIARVHIEGSKEVFETDKLFSAIPASRLGSVLAPENIKLSETLRRIKEVTVAVVNIEVDGDVLSHQGFGYLVPSCEPSPILGVTFDSLAFPEHNRLGTPSTRITCMMGGAWFEEVFGDPHLVNKDDLLKTAISSIQSHLNISLKPTYTNVSIHHDCIPQYKVGHSQLLDDIHKYISHHQLPLHLFGASYKGVAINDCIYNARKAVLALEH